MQSDSEPRRGPTEAPQTGGNLLGRWWQAVRQLSPPQARALLLSAEDARGMTALTGLLLSGEASLVDVAACLAVSPESLAGVWPRLPLGPNSLAVELGVSPSTVERLESVAAERALQLAEPL